MNRYSNRCPECRTEQYFYLMMPEQVLVSFCLCGVTLHDTKKAKKK